MKRSCVKLTVIFLCFLFIITCIIAFLNPVSGYELSIYSGTPFLVWILLLIGIFGTSFLTVNEVYLDTQEKNKFWILGLFLIILFRLLLLYIPYIRGYASWRGDNIYHVGMVYDILSTSHISDDFYPITHILISEIRLVTNFKTLSLVNYATALFSVCNIFGLYLLSSSLFSSPKIRIVSIVTAGTVTFNTYSVYFMPNGASLLYTPFVFYFYSQSLKSKNKLSYAILLTITLVLYPFFHPLSTIILIAYFFLILIMSIMFFSKKEIISDTEIFSSTYLINTISLIIVILILWLLSYHIFDANIINLYTSLTTGNSPNAIAGMSNRLDKIDINGLGLIKLIIKSMGDDLIYLFLSLCCFIITVKSRCARTEDRNMLFLTILCLSTCLFYFLYLFNIIPGLNNIRSERFLFYLSLFTPICGAYIFNHISYKNINYVPVLFVFIIMLPSIISISSLYESPYILRPNQQITHMDIEGTRWFLKYENDSIKTTTIMSPTRSFAAGVIGYTKAVSKFDRDELKIPDHFNYTAYNQLGNSYDKQSYAIIRKFDSVIYDHVWAVVGRFSNGDFKKIEFDHTVDKIYSNNETQVFLIHPMKINATVKTNQINCNN